MIGPERNRDMDFDQTIMLEKEVRNDYERLTKELILRGLTITTMESITAGQIASLITDTEGSSAALRGAFVTYSNEAKILQGVPAETIERYSVYSEETAAAMADACRKAYQADIGIGVTGTAGTTDPENPEASETGTVYYAFSMARGTESFTVHISPQETRHAYKMAVAGEIVTALLNELKQAVPGNGG